MGIDVIYAAFRTDPVGSVFPCPEGPVGSVFPRHHSGTQRRIFRKERFAAALGKAEENRKEDGLDERECFTRALLSFSEGCFVKWESPAERLFVKRI